MHNIRGLLATVIPFVILAVLFTAVNGPSSAMFSQFIGSAALVAMALSHLISTRTWIVERFFGPLDQAYVLHKWLGIGAIVAILLHDNIGAEIKALGQGTNLNDLAEDLGEQSLNGLLVLVAITLITFIPYRIWYWTHRAMGVFFILGAIHYAFILKPFSNFDPLGLYVLGFCLIGIISYIYTWLPRRWLAKKTYTVRGIEKTGHASAITLQPNDHPMRHRAGQFAFFSFEAPRLKETHPFSISNAPQEDGAIRITVANLGDYTAQLKRNLQVGTQVRIQGPYGHFFPNRGKKPQVWIAGGIGITPFLAWLEGIKKDGPKVDLIYTFRGVLNAPHLSQVKALCAEHTRVNLHLFDTSSGPRLTIDALENLVDLKTSKVSFCGPTVLRDNLKAGVNSWNFHSEAFEIRTGLPIPKRFTQYVSSMIMKPINLIK